MSARFTDNTGTFDVTGLDPEKTSFIILYAKDDKGEVTGRLLIIPFEQRPLDDTLHPGVLGYPPSKFGNMYDVEVTDRELKKLLVYGR